MRSSTLLAGILSLGYASALSGGCTSEIAVLALGDLGSCLQLTQLLPVLSASGSIVPSINTYLGSLCSSSTPICSNSTLTSAASSIQSSCSSDISGGGSTAAEVDGLLVILNDYPEFQAAGCSKNSTTNGYCVTETLNTVQTASGSNLTTSFLTSLLSGTDATATTALTSAFNSGNLCTGCVQGIYYEALKANASIASTSLGQSLTSKCGSSFGASSTPSTVASTTAAAGSSSSAATTSAAKSNSMITAQPFAGTGGVILAAFGVVGSIALGGLATL